jgi:hypothetical protein
MEEAILAVVLTRIMRTRLADCLIIISRSTKAPKVLQHTTAVPSKLTRAKGEKRHCNSRVQQSAGNNSFNLLAAAGATARDRRASSGPGARAMERNRALSLRRCTHGRRQHQSRLAKSRGSMDTDGSIRLVASSLKVQRSGLPATVTVPPATVRGRGPCMSLGARTNKRTSKTRSRQQRMHTV